MQASPSLHVVPAHTQRCEVVLQLTPERPFEASHCAVVLHPQAPLKQENFETRPPCELHTFPQAPQSLESVFRFDSQPSSGTSLLLSLQLPQPALQVGAQLLPEHAVELALAIEHVRLHLPQ